MSGETPKFSLKDVITFFIYIIPVIFFFSTMNNKIENLTDKVNTMQTDKKDDAGQFRTFVQSFQAQQNQNTQDILLIKQQLQFFITSKAAK